MASFKRILLQCPLILRWLVLAAAIVGFLWACAQFRYPGQGFTYLINFGAKQDRSYLPELKTTNFYEHPDSYGYDAQYYAQIAIHPRLSDPALNRAVDTLPYRARRILFCWTAYVLGGGDPARVLEVYAVQNIAAWLLLGIILLRWFPPTTWSNALRWVAVMFTCGLCNSMRDALVDGPSLLLIALAMLIVELGRMRWAAALIGLAGLGKETNILAGAVFGPDRWTDRRCWWRTLGFAVLVVSPLAVWLLCLKVWLGTGGDAGARNFAWPFVGYFHRWQESIAGVREHPHNALAWSEVAMHVALTVQWLFFAVRPRWSDRWWRLGASYALLMVVLGDAVWEGYPGASARVLLPMVLAFNVALPRGKRWWIVLLLGNLLVWPSADALLPPGRRDYTLSGPYELRVASRSDDLASISFVGDDWYAPERTYFSFWRWSGGSASIAVHNPQPFPVVAEVSFSLTSLQPRQVTVRDAGGVLWSGSVDRQPKTVTLSSVVLPAGNSTWRFETDLPGARPPNGDLRKLAFRVSDLDVRIVRRAPAASRAGQVNQ